MIYIGLLDDFIVKDEMDIFQTILVFGESWKTFNHVNCSFLLTDLLSYVSIDSFRMRRMIAKFLSNLNKLKPSISAHSTDARL